MPSDAAVTGTPSTVRGDCRCGQCDECWLQSLVSSAIEDGSGAAWRALTRRSDDVPDPTPVRLVHSAATTGTDAFAEMTIPQRLRALRELIELLDYEKARAVVDASNEGMAAGDIGVLLGTGSGYVRETLARVDASVRHAHRSRLPEPVPAPMTPTASDASPTGRHRLELVVSEPSASDLEAVIGAARGSHRATCAATAWDGIEDLADVEAFGEPHASPGRQDATGRHRAVVALAEVAAAVL